MLDESGNGSVGFQAVGNNVRITNLSVAVSSQNAQAKATTYKGQIGDAFRISGTNSGSTGDNAPAAIDLLDGEILYVVWTGGDPSAIATATFSGYVLPFKATPADGVATWTDPIAAGDGTLIYPALKSPNYVPGESGWQLDKEGTAELNTVIIRGDMYVDGPGISAIKGYVREVEGANGVFIPVLDYQVDNDTFSPGCTYAYEDPPYVYYVVEGARNFNNPGRLPARVIVRSESSDGSGLSNIVIHECDNMYVLRYDAAGNIIPNAANVGIYGYCSVTGPVYGDVFLAGLDNTDTGRGVIYSQTIATVSSTIGATEGQVFSSGSLFRKNRAYEITARGKVNVNTAAGAPNFKFRKSNVSGQILYDFGGVWCGTTGANYNVTMTGVFTVGNADINTAWTLTMTGSSTWTANFGNPRCVELRDIGPSSAFVGYTQLV